MSIHTVRPPPAIYAGNHQATIWGSVRFPNVAIRRTVAMHDPATATLTVIQDPSRRYPVSSHLCHQDNGAYGNQTATCWLVLTKINIPIVVSVDLSAAPFIKG